MALIDLRHFLMIGESVSRMVVQNKFTSWGYDPSGRAHACARH